MLRGGVAYTGEALATHLWSIYFVRCSRLSVSLLIANTHIDCRCVDIP